jgi:hypothetical protein
MEETEIDIKFLLENIDGKDNFVDEVVDVMIILKQILRKQVINMFDSSNSGCSQIMGFWVYRKGKEFRN